MSFLFAKPAKQIPALTGLQIQTSVNILPIPIVFGSPLLQMNVIYVNGFRSVKQSSGGGGLFGKGILGSSKSTTTGYKYYATFIGAIGEGEINDLVEVYDNQSVYTGSNIPQHKAITIFQGTHTQPPWSYITSHWANDAFGYKDTAYLGFPDYQLDVSATIPMLNFVMHGIASGSSPLNPFTNSSGTVSLLDADPSICIENFLIHERYGVRFPSAYIDFSTLDSSADATNPAIGDAAISTYCQAVGMAWSVVLNNYEPASSILDRWCNNLVIAAVWTGAVLKFIPYLEVATSANTGLEVGGTPKYYTPNVPVLFEFTADDFVQGPQGDDPLVVSRIDIADVKNVVRIDYRDRSNQWNSTVTEAKEETLVELYGPRVERMNAADEFCLLNYATPSATMRLQRNCAIRNTYSFKLDWRWCILDPMDIVTLTYAPLGLSQTPVRIRSLEEDEKGILSVVAEEFPPRSASATIYAAESNSGSTHTTNAVPPSVNTPFIFEPTSDMLNAQGKSVPQIVVGASGGPAGAFSADWGGCDIYVSDDNVTYEFQGTLTGPSRQGVTTATLNSFAGANPDNTNTLSVNLSESEGTLSTVTSTQAAQGLSLCAIMDANGDLEVLGYTTATLTSAFHYDLTGLYRGLYGTVACTHASGSQFLRVDGNVFEQALPPGFVGIPLFVKLASFNSYGQSTQDLSACTVYNYTPTGAGTDLFTDPIVSALLAGTSVDLNAATSETLDLNTGGAGACSPTLAVIDLGVL